jgi:hypothetical protein
MRLHLDVCNSPMVRGDALALTALTSLTYLALPNANQGVGDVTATALACSLTQLCYLDLAGCDLGHMACLGSIAHLTQLTRLNLDRNPGVNEQGLMLLTSLRLLRRVNVAGCSGVDAAALARYWEL